MDLNLNFAVGDGRRISTTATAAVDPPAGTAALTSLLNGGNDAQKQAILRALAATAMAGSSQQQQQQPSQQAPPPPPPPPPPAPAAPVQRGVGQSNSGASAALSALLETPVQPTTSTNNGATEHTLRTLLLLRANQAALQAGQQPQQQQHQQAVVAPQPPPPPPPPPPAAPLAQATSHQLADLQGLARLRAAGLEGLLAAAAAAPPAPPPPQQPAPAAAASRISDLDLLRLRAAITSNPARNGSDLIEQARLLSAINSHQQALASVGEAERRLTMLLGGQTGAVALNGAAGALAVAVGAAAGTVCPPTTTTTTTTTTNPSPPGMVAAATAAAGLSSPEHSSSTGTNSSAATSLVARAAAGAAAEKNPKTASTAAISASAGGDPQRGGGRSDAEKLALLEQLGNPTKCVPCLPPVEEGNTPHYSQRIIVPLGMEEDANWLSERQCFIRSELLEVVRASHEEVLVRSSSKSIAYQQVGIRCRYCAHLQAGSRAIRASAFPSSIRQMYQSFTMMVRDHFGNCVGVPPEKKQRFLKLKGLTSPSSSLSRQYWSFAAKKLGMKDSEYGIMINEETQAEAQKIPPFGTSAEETAAIQAARVELMVEERDQNAISPYLYFLMSQAQMVYLLPSERVGKRKDAAVGLPGFGCTHCAKVGRLGFCRMFPLNKRSLPDKVNDLYNHMIRCPKAPRMTKRLLESRRTEQETNRIFAERDRDFIDRIWIKLGRDQDEAFKKP